MADVNEGQLSGVRAIMDELKRAELLVARVVSILSGCDEIGAALKVPLPVPPQGGVFTFHTAEVIELMRALEDKREAIEEHHKYSLYPSANRARIARQVRQETEDIGMLG